jgi:hypothetical protein
VKSLYVRLAALSVFLFAFASISFAQSYVPIFTDDFSRADTAYGAFGAPNTNVGIPSIFGPGQTPAAWTDRNGSFWAVKSHELVFNAAEIAGTDAAAGANSSVIQAPAGSYLNQKFVGTFTVPATPNTLLSTLFFRLKSDNSAFLLEINRDSFDFGFCNGGGIASSTIVSYGVHSGITDGSGYLIGGRQYIVTVSVTSAGPGATTLSATFADRISGNVFATQTQSGSFTPDSDNHRAGGFGIGQRSNSSSFTPLAWDSIALSYLPDSNLVTSSNLIQAGSASQGVVLNGVGTTWQSTAPAFEYSGATVDQVGGVRVLSDTQAVVYLTVAGSQAGNTLTITDPTQTTKNTVSIPIVAAAGQSAGIDIPFSVPDSDPTKISIAWLPAFGGLAPYTYKAYRGRNTSFSAGDAGVVDVSAGLDVANLRLRDTPPDGKIYCYFILATDSTGTPVAARSYAVPGIAAFIYPPAYPTGTKTLAGIQTVTMEGDSIQNYQDSGNASLLTKETTALSSVISGLTYVNAGMAGTHITDFDPDFSGGRNLYSGENIAIYGTPLKPTLQARGNGGYLTIWLGANDEFAAGETKAVWKTSLQSEITHLQSDFPGIKIMVHYPYWKYTNQVTNDNLIGFCDAIDEVATANTGVYVGDRNMIVYQANRALTADGTHLNDAGSTVLAKYQTNAFVNTFALAASPLFRSRAGSRSRLAN